MNEEKDMYLFNFAIVFANDGNHMGLLLTYDAKNYGILGYNNIDVIISSSVFDYKNTYYLKYHCYCTSAANTSTSLKVYGEIVYF